MVILVELNLSAKTPPIGPKITIVSGMIESRTPESPEDKPRALTR